MATTTTEHPANTVVKTGPESLQDATALLVEHSLPNGLLPLQDVVECGYNQDTGFVWVTQKKAIVHKFEAIAKQVSYGQKITAYLEKGRLKKLTGVKAKELLLWVTIVDIALEDHSKSAGDQSTASAPAAEDTLFFKSFTGIGKSFPVSAFVQNPPPKTA